MDPGQAAALGIIIPIPFLFIGITIAILWFKNKRGGPQSKQNVVAVRPKWQQWLIFFFKELFLELLSLGWTIYSIVQVETGSYDPDDLSTFKIPFYIFLVLKYIIIIITILRHELLFEEKIEGIIQSVVMTGWAPSNFLEIASSWIFVPCIIMDGFLTVLGTNNNGEFDPFRLIDCALLGFDTLIYIKENVFMNIEAYTYVGRYKLLSIYYSLVELFYTIILIFTVITMFSRVPSLNLDVKIILVITTCVTHPIISRWTSMTLQGIKATSASIALRKAPKVKVNALRFYIRLFLFHPIAIICTLALYILQTAFYAFVLIGTIVIVQSGSGNDPVPFINGALIAMCTLALIWTSFYILNLAVSFGRRMGVIIQKCCGCHFPMDCSKYAKAMNRALAECNANFLMDSHMQCA